MIAARLRALQVLSPAILLASICAAGACGSSDSAAPDPHASNIDTGVPLVDATAPEPDAADTAAPQDAATVDASLLAPGFVYRDVNHVLGTGQSLSVGTLGTPVQSLAQPYANITFVTGVLSGGTGLTSFVPLVEQNVETHSSAFANLVTMMARDVILVDQPVGQTSHDLLVSQHGIGGQPYSAIKKGGTTACYANSMAQAKAGHDLAIAAGKSYVIRAVTNVHGESDHIALNTAYEANLLEWQADYETDAKALTGQPEGVPMLHSQISSWTRFASSTTSAIPAAQLAAHVDSAGKVVLVGAKYHLPYVADGVHLTTEGYQHMGEDYAKVYRRVILEGKPWEPVRPKTVTRAGAVVSVTMHVPAPPLVLEVTTASWSRSPLLRPPRIRAFAMRTRARAARSPGRPPDRAATSATPMRLRHATATSSTTGPCTSRSLRLSHDTGVRGAHGRERRAQRFGGMNPGGTPGR